MQGFYQETIEEWRRVPIDGYGELYEVSSLGRVRRVSASYRNSWPAGRVRKMTSGGKWGHVKAVLYKDNRHKSIWLHRLVALAFIGPPPTPRHEVAHMNGNAADNRVSNLRWSTSSENKMDQVRHGTKVIGERHHMAKLTESGVREMRKLRTSGVLIKDIADRFGVSRMAASRAIRGVDWKHVV